MSQPRMTREYYNLNVVPIDEVKDIITKAIEEAYQLGRFSELPPYISKKRAGTLLGRSYRCIQSKIERNILRVNEGGKVMRDDVVREMMRKGERKK
jgi:hypothetical protein